MTGLNSNMLKHLPFYDLTEISFHSTIQSNENRLKSFINNTFKKTLSDCLPEILHSDVECSYYEDSAFNYLTSKHHPLLSILHFNLRSLNKHGFEFFDFITNLNIEFDILCLTEIGRTNVENCLNIFKDYEYHYCLPEGNFGGVACLFRKNLELISTRTDLSLASKLENDNDYSVENIWLEFKIPQSNNSFLLGAMYRHPKGKIQLFQNEIEKTINMINKENKLCFICGDININALSTNHNNSVNFFNVLMSENYIPKITIPTRITDYSATLIDHIFMKYDSKTVCEKTVSGNLVSDISDHLPNFLLYGTKSKQPKLAEKQFIRVYNKKNKANFQKYLQDTNNWETFNRLSDCNDATEEYFKVVNKGFELNFPLKPLSKKRSKNKSWFTAGLHKSCRTKFKLYKKYLNKPNVKNKEKYNKYKNLYNRLIKVAKEQYYNELITGTKSSIYKLWEIFGPIVNPSKAKNSTKISKLLVNDKITYNERDIAECFNAYFCNIGTSLAQKIPETNINPGNYLSPPILNSIYLDPITEDELCTLVSKLNHKKSVGPNDIPIKIFKQSIKELKGPILKIMNLSFENGIFPNILKIAKVIPLFKKSDPLKTENYRPISILSYISKILEKLMHKRIYSFLQHYHVPLSVQFGFRPNHSTNLALIEILEILNQALDKGEWTLGIYLDLSKAFDTVNHEILKQKLLNYGIRGEAFNWFSSYLSNRSQYVQIGKIKSRTKTISTGVPQGSVLGPLLFLLYVNDILNAISTPNVKLMMFADDTNLFLSGKNVIQIKRDIETASEELYDWFKTNKLTLNIEKTCFSIIHSAHRNIPAECSSLTISNQVIKRTDCVKYLGVDLDDKLKWNQHIDNLSKYLIKCASSFKLIKHLIPYKCKRQLYFAFAFSKICYGIEVYGNTSKHNLNKIQTLQNKILKILYNRDWFTPTNILHKELRLLKITDIQKLSTAKFVYKQRKNELPEIFNDYFKSRNQIHSINTRHANHLHLIKVKSKFGSNTMKYRGVKVYNELPNNIINSSTTKSFKKHVTNWYISKY